MDCSVCESAAARYTCPRCSRRTCSASCSKSHKSAHSCSGERDKAAYVPLDRYGWSDLMLDYGYLESVGRRVREGKAREKEDDGKAGRTRRELVRRAAEQGVELVLLPDGMERRRKNHTAWLHKQRKMSWSVELSFPTGSTSAQFLPTVSSSTPLSSLLTFKRIRLPDPSLASTPSSATFVLPVDPFAKDKDKPVVHVLDRDAHLGDALRGKRVFEWPKVQIWPSQRWEEQVLLGKVVVVGGAVGSKTVEERGVKRAREEDPGEEQDGGKRALVEYASSDGASDVGDAIP